MQTFSALPGAHNSNTTLKVVMDEVSLAFGPAVTRTGLPWGYRDISGVKIGHYEMTAGGSGEPWEGMLMALTPGLRAVEGQCPREPCAPSPVTLCPLPGPLSPPLT